jgi:Ca2+/H+ antiporter
MATMTDPLIVDLDEDVQKGLLIISRGTAILLLGVYIAYFFFQRKTHAAHFMARDAPKMSVTAAGLGYVRAHHPCFSGLGIFAAFSLSPSPHRSSRNTVSSMVAGICL